MKASRTRTMGTTDEEVFPGVTARVQEIEDRNQPAVESSTAHPAHTHE